MLEIRTHTTPVDYNQALSFMQEHVEAMISQDANDLLWLLEHPALYTAGTSANPDDLLAPKRFPVYDAGRGGEYTYHGPGQRIGYVMMNLYKLHQGKADLRLYVNQLEQWIINTLARIDIQGERRENRVGIWVVNPDGSEDKIAAIGVRVRKWMAFHGIALNLSPDLEHFTGIVPCGISQHGVTSIQKLGVSINMQKLDILMIEEFKKIFCK